VTEKPTHARYGVILFAVTLAILSYIDRVCISQAGPEIARELKFDDVQMVKIFGAFALSYALFEIPGGWMGDWMGPRKVLLRIVLWWSAFTALTGAMRSFVTLWVTRFLFGAGEAGCFPNLTKAFTTWLPPVEHVRAQGIMWTFARWGGAFTPLLVVWVFSFMSWRHAFELFGVIGIFWAIWFYGWFRDNPRDHRSVNAAELELLQDTQQNSAGHGNVPWAKMLASRTVWLLWLQYFCFSYGWYFYITWLPTYLKEARGLELEKGALLAGLPLFFGGIGSMLCGTFSVRLARWIGDVPKTRRWLAYIGYGGAAGMLLVSMQVHNPVWAMLSMGLASFSLDLSLPGSWNTCMDVGGRFAGTVSGSMNMAGNIAGGVAPVAVGYILDYSDRNWPLTFWISAAIYIVGGLCWTWIDPVTPLEEAPTEVPRLRSEVIAAK